jgi:uncharacterized membrane protein
MAEPKHDRSKMHYQLDRISFFSDGVFAIAITLLIIEFKVPVIEHATDAVLWHALSHMILKFLGFLISFAIVGYYWSVHHRIFGYVDDYTTRLIWINLFFLFSVVLLPFSSGLLGEYSSELELHLPYGIYVINILLAATMNGVLWLYVSHPKRKLLTHQISPERIRLGLYFTFVVPVLFILSYLVTLKAPLAGRFIPVLIPLVLKYGMRGLARKALQQEEARLSRVAENNQEH